MITKPIPRNAKELISECNDYCMRFDKEVMNDNVENIKYKYLSLLYISIYILLYWNILYKICSYIKNNTSRISSK